MYGKTLQKGVMKQKYSDDEIIQIGIHLVRQFKYVHSNGYVHCDLKPNNITVGYHRSYDDKTLGARLIDFGLAKPFLQPSGEHIPDIL